MNVLIIGYGSIGKRHESVLERFEFVSAINIVTKQKLVAKKTFYNLEEVTNLDSYDYILIASETNKHYEQIKFLEDKVKNKIILCEKPLFENKKILEIKHNSLYVGYVLRFHPLLLKLKKELEKERVISVNVNCGQYLPTWRKDIDYRNSYSAKKEEGGGVLLDLSHEIDYIQWLFGKIITFNSIQDKISDLEINSDDLSMLIGKTVSNIYVNLSIDYISKIPYRRMLVHTLNKSFELDFIANSLKVVKKDAKTNEFKIAALERNFMFEEMHKSVLFNKDNICTYIEGLEVMDTINTIQEQNI